MQGSVFLIAVSLVAATCVAAQPEACDFPSQWTGGAESEEYHVNGSSRYNFYNISYDAEEEHVAIRAVIDRYGKNAK